MGTFKISCKKCGQKLEADESWIGMEAECPQCGIKITVTRTVIPKLRIDREEVENTVVSNGKPDLTAGNKDTRSLCNAHNEHSSGDTPRKHSVSNKKNKSRAFFVLISIFPVSGLLGINNCYAGYFFRCLLKIIALMCFLGTCPMAVFALYFFCVLEAFFVKRDAHDQPMPWFNWNDDVY